MSDKTMTICIAILLITAAIYVIFMCFVGGYETERDKQMERIIAAHLEAKKHPIKYSQAAEFATVWETMNQERVEVTK